MVVNVEQAANVETDRAREPNVIAPAASHELLRKQNDYYLPIPERPGTV